MRPYKLELAIYSSLQDAQPRTIIALWKASLEELKLHHSDPSVTIVDNTTKTRIKLGPSSEKYKEQLKWFSEACKGIPREGPAFLHNNVATVPPTAPPPAEDPEMAIAISASTQSAIQGRPPLPDAQPNSETSSSSSGVNANKFGLLVAAIPSTSCSQLVQTHDNISVAHTCSGLDFDPSAPPVADEIPVDGPIHYPSIDLSPVDISSPVVAKLPKEEAKNAVGSDSSCVICLDAPAEGACIPCGHVAGCMPCLKEVKAKKWGCPVCRAKLDQVIKLYRV